MGMTESEFKDVLARYAASKCTMSEVLRLREYVSSHPEYLSMYFSALRKKSMATLGINTASDPFHRTVAMVGNVGAPDRVRARSFIKEFFSEKKSHRFVPNSSEESIGGVNELKTTNQMNTVNIKKETLETIAANARKMMESANTEKSTFDNMVVAMMAENPTMSVDDAVNACRGLLEGVTGFDKTYAELRESGKEGDALTEDVYSRCLDILDQRDLSLNEQAAILINFIALTKYTDAENLRGAIEGKDMKEFSEILAEETKITGEVTPEMIEALKAQLKESISTSSIALTGEEQLRQLVEGNENGASLAEGLAEKHRSLAEYKSYCAVAAYIEACKGNIEGCDATVDPNVLGASVAAGIEREEIMDGVKTGTVSVPQAVKALKYIAGALLTALFIWIAYKLALVTMSLSILASVFLLGQGWLALIAGLIIGGYASYKGTMWFGGKVVKSILEGLGKGYDTVVETLLSGSIKDKIKGGFNAFIASIKQMWGMLTGRNSETSVNTVTA